MPRNHELFVSHLIRVCLFAFPFVAFELLFTRLTTFGVATGGAAFSAALLGVVLDRLLLGSDAPPADVHPPTDEQDQGAETKSAKKTPPTVDVHDSPLFKAYRVDLAQLKSDLARAKKQIKSMESENGELRLQLIESESKLLADTKSPFPVSDDVLELGYHGAVDDFKRRVLIQSISRTNGNRAEAARQLGLQRTYLYRLVKQFQVKA